MLRTSFLKSITLLVCIILLTVATLTLSSCRNNDFDKETREELEGTVDGVLAASEVPGALAGVWMPGDGEWETARGEADIESGRRLELTDTFRIGSTTKSFTATVVLLLVEEGKVALDDSIDKYVKGVPNGSSISIRQLLNMTSGLFNFAEDEGFKKRFDEDPLMEISQQEKLDIAFKHEPYFQPGEGFHNSETNYVLIGMLIEEVTGNSAGEEIKKRILDPLKLESTSLPTTPDMTGSYSHSYVYFQEQDELLDYTRINPSIPWVGGGMVSNLPDLRVWAGALANGDLLSEEMHKEQLGWIDIPGGEELNLKYGLGVYYVDGFIGGAGALFGYNSVAYYLPERDATFVAFTNATFKDSQEAALIFISIVKQLLPGKLEKF